MEVFRAVPQVKKITIEIVDMDRLDIDDLDSDEANGLVEDYKLPTKRVSYIGYVKGPGCPVPVEIGVARVHAEYNEEFPTEEDAASMTSSRRYYSYKRSNINLLRDWLMEVVRKLPQEVADSLLYDDNGASDGNRILVALGWIEPPTTTPSDDVNNNVVNNDNSEAESNTKGEDVETGN